MKTQTRTQPLRAYLRNLTFASAVGAAAIYGAGTQARADLVGHWLSGAENLENVSSTGSVHHGVAVGNTGGLGYSTDLPPGFTNTSLRSLSLSNGAAVQVDNSATSDAGYQNTFDGGSGSSTITIAFWAKGFPGDWSPWIAKGGEGPNPGYGWQFRRMGGSSFAGFTVRGVPDADGWPGTGINANDPNWHHFAAVWDPSTGTRTVYVDGVFSHIFTASSGTMIQSPGNHLIIGGRQTDYPNLSHFYTGNLFDVRIYNNALGQEEIINLIPMPAPQGLIASPGSGRVSLSWTPIPLATDYTVSITPSLGGTEVIETVFEPSYVKEFLTNGVSYDFKVLATKGNGSGPYSAVVSATPAASSACDIVSFDFLNLGSATISGTNITKYVPTSVDVTQLLAYYSVSPFATGDATFPSGSEYRDYTTPQTFTNTAEDGITTKTYTVTVIEKDPITYDFNGGLQDWAQIWPVTGTLPLWQDWQTGGLGTPEGPAPLSDDAPQTRFGRSPEFFLNFSGPLTFQLAGGRGALAAPVPPSSIPKYAVQNGGFAGVALRDVVSNTYVLSKRRAENGGTYQTGGFTAAELAQYVIPGKRYTLDFIDYNRGDWGWTRLDNVSIPGDPAPVIPVAPDAKITSFNFPNEATIDDLNGTVTLPSVPFGTSVSAVITTFTLSDGATCDRVSGATQDLTSPVTYTVTSAVTPSFPVATAKAYTVSVTVKPNPALALVGRWVSGAESLTDTSGYAPGVHNGVAVGNVGSLQYSTDVPAGFSGKSLDLSAGGVGVMINNSAIGDGGYQTTFDDQSRSQITVAFWAKGFPGNWSPWVAKGGEDGAGWQVRRVENLNVAGFTIRGLANEDHRGGTINVNDTNWHHFVGVWDQTTGVRSLYVDGVFSHSVNNFGSVMAMAANQHLALGARQTDGVGFGNYFAGKLFDVRIYKQALFASELPAIMTPTSSPDLFPAWIEAHYPALTDKTAAGDPDNDGMTNQQEFAYGLDPSRGTSASPITVLPDKTTGVFRYTRLNPSVSGLTYTIKTSTNLVDWVTDAGATAGQTVSSSVDDVQTMQATLSGAPLGATKLFVRVSAE